jgi:hypothetical protein
MVAFNRTDLEFVLQQILMAEAGQSPVSPHLAFGLREVAGTDNNSVPGQGTFGAADQVFPRVTELGSRQATRDQRQVGRCPGICDLVVAQRTVPVDSFEPNPWGLHDVHGNVWEWTEDCWNESNSDNRGDGRARKSGDCSSRVLRGGSWINSPVALRSANRYFDATVNRSIDVGFRVGKALTR